MLTNNNSVSFVATLDAATSRIFYEESLGLDLISDEHFALVFDLNGHMLRIAKVNALEPAEHTVLGWHVAIIAEAVKEWVGRGVVFENFEGMLQDELGIWASPSPLPSASSTASYSYGELTRFACQLVPESLGDLSRH